MKILVTGINGFVGNHLLKELHANGHRVIGVGQQGQTNTKKSDLLAEYYACDLTDLEEVSKLPLDTVGAIINLAGLANVGRSFAVPDLYQKVNVGIIRNLGEVLVKKKLKSVRLLAISTGAVYSSNQHLPLVESSLLVNQSQTNPYVKSKIAMERAIKRLNQQGLRCLIVRPFNHIGPGQGTGFILPDLAAQLNAVQNNKRKSISVGDLDKRRDFTDVRDVARAYRLLATAKQSQINSKVYNICQGVSHSGQELLDLLQKGFGIKSIQTKLNPSLVRPNDPQDLYGSYVSLKRDTGWQPNIPLEKTVSDFVDWYKSDGSVKN